VNSSTGNGTSRVPWRVSSLHVHFGYNVVSYKNKSTQRSLRPQPMETATQAPLTLPTDTNRKDFDRRVQKALELLQQSSVGGPIRLADIAATVHVSSSHLRHLFKRETGTSVTHYVRLLRLRRAKELLETSFLSVKEVMSAVGFNDFSHFVREYKATFGRTPSETRRSVVGKLPSSSRARNSGQ
jgi:transcriptional regulator GlxA family with amidase domain